MFCIASPFKLHHSSPSPPHVQNVIRSTTPINDEMAHQLYVLQVLTFNLLEDRMMTKMDPQDQVGTKETKQSPNWRRQHMSCLKRW